MSQGISLQDAERKVFISTFGDGLLDIFLGAVFSQFAITPFLSDRFGDLWNAALFIPVWGILFLLLWGVRKVIVRPRVGNVEFSLQRKLKLKQFNVIMLIAGIASLGAAMFSTMHFENLPGWLHTLQFGAIMLIGLSLAGFLLDLNRLYFYGVLLASAPPVGEWLYASYGASHHGFPITFGIASGIMICHGLYLFVRLILENPIPPEIAHSGE
jgi:hypothetical protein